jgi:mycothiol synthase
VHRLEIKRHMAAADIAAVNDLLLAVERADGHRPLSDQLWLDLVHGGRAGFAGLLAWDRDHDHAVGYAQVSRGNDSWTLELVLHPHVRDESTSLGPELVGAAIDVVRAEGGGHVHWWVFEPTSAQEELAAGAGLRPGRSLFQMRCALPPTRPATIDTRPFVPGVDDEAWLAVNNRAFRSHAEQGGWDVDTLRLRVEEPWFDPAGFLLHERDGRLAGFCWTKLHTDTRPVLGEIYVIAVDPDFHGLGLGAELTLAGLHSIADRGVRTGMLYVDADNTAAVSLYRKLGFAVNRTDRAFVGDVEAGAPTTAPPADPTRPPLDMEPT